MHVVHVQEQLLARLGHIRAGRVLDDQLDHCLFEQRLGVRGVRHEEAQEAERLRPQRLGQDGQHILDLEVARVRVGEQALRVRPVQFEQPLQGGRGVELAPQRLVPQRLRLLLVVCLVLLQHLPLVAYLGHQHLPLVAYLGPQLQLHSVVSFLLLLFFALLFWSIVLP